MNKLIISTIAVVFFAPHSLGSSIAGILEIAEGGEVVLERGSKLTIEESGKIHIEEGGEFQVLGVLDGVCTMKIDGKLVINANNTTSINCIDHITGQVDVLSEVILSHKNGETLIFGKQGEE